MIETILIIEWSVKSVNLTSVRLPDRSQNTIMYNTTIQIADIGMPDLDLSAVQMVLLFNVRYSNPHCTFLIVIFDLFQCQY